MVVGRNAERQALRRKILVGGMLVRAEHGTGLHIGEDVTNDLLGGGAGQHDRLHVAVALAHAEHASLAYRAATFLELLRFVLVGFLAADIGLVGLDDAGQEAAIATGIRATSFAQALEHEPRRLLRDADLLGQLQG